MPSRKGTNQREHMSHLIEDHKKKLRIILHFKQDLIPMCGVNGFFGDASCGWSFHDVLHCMDLNKGHKFLHMEESCPVSPRSPKAWEKLMGIADEHYIDYKYENEWDSDY